jgi:hypothetical protein
MQLEPFFCLFDLADTRVSLAIAIQADQFAIPLRIQAVGEQLPRAFAIL